MAPSFVFHIVYGFLCTIIAKLSSCNRDQMACKAKSIYYLAIYRKSLLSPELQQLNFPVTYWASAKDFIEKKGSSA